MALSVSIKKKLKDFELDVKFKTDGKYLGILGASGSGKSLTLKCIAGVEIPDEGRIELNGKILFDSKKNINIRPQERKIGYLFQNYALFPNMTVERNIGTGIKLSKEDKKTKIKKLINLFHLEGMENKYPSQLSGGQQQRVALARIFAYNPNILMLDEPFSALDCFLKEQLHTEISDLLKLYDGEVLMVSHSRDEVYKFCENLVIIENGKSIHTGKTKEAFKDPKFLTSASLTGCKNITKIQVLNSHNIYAVDWGINLKIKKEIPLNTKYIGVRAHDIKMVQEKTDENIIFCSVVKIVEEMHEFAVFLKANTNIPKGNKKNYRIWMNIKKDEWSNININDELYIKIPEESIMLLEK